MVKNVKAKVFLKAKLCTSELVAVHNVKLYSVCRSTDNNRFHCLSKLFITLVVVVIIIIIIIIIMIIRVINRTKK